MEYDAMEFADQCANFIDRCANARHNVLVDEWHEEAKSTGAYPDRINGYTRIKTQDGMSDYAGTLEVVLDSLKDAEEDAHEAYRASIGAPSEEAMRYIQLLGMKDKLTEGDVKAAVRRYGDQLDAFNAIKDMAARSGVPFYYQHPLEHGGRIIDALAARTFKYIDAISNGGLSEARLEAAKTELNEIAANQDALGRRMFI